MKKDLHEAVLDMIEQYGEEIISDKSIVDKISKYKRYNLRAPYYYVFCAVVNDGIAEKILDLGEWDEEGLDEIFQDYGENTGFDSNALFYVFQSIGYGLNWIDEIQYREDDEDEEYEYGPDKFWRDMSDDDFENFILSKFDWDHDVEKKVGVEITDITIQPVNEFTGFNIQYLAKAKGEIKGDFVQMRYLCYDNNNKFKGMGDFYIISRNKPCRFGTVFVDFGTDLRKLGKIEFVLDD